MQPFAGSTYSPTLDGTRLKTQLEQVREIMADGQWRTFGQIQAAQRVLYGKQGSEAAISARLRDLRKREHGGHQVERRRGGGSGLWEYQLSLRTEGEPQLALDPSWRPPSSKYTGMD